MRKWLLLFLLLPLWSLAAREVPHYRLEITADPERGKILGALEVDLSALVSGKAGDPLTLMLLLNQGEEKNPHLFGPSQEKGPGGFSPAFARVDNVRINNRDVSWRYRAPDYATAVTYSREHLLCEITLPEEWGEENVLTFSYEVQLSHSRDQDDYAFDDAMVSRFSWFPYLLTEDYGKETAFSLPFFTYSARVSLPSGWTMAAGACEFRETGIGEFSQESLTPVSSFPLAFLRDFRVYARSIQEGEKTLRIYYRPGEEGAARLIATYAEEALDYYRKVYFPLETRNISIVENTPGSYGMAADSLVLLGSGLFGGLDRIFPGLIHPLLDMGVVHELGHFYFGIPTPPDFLRDNWLSEGLNEYSTLVYLESRYGIWNNIFNKDDKDIGAFLLRKGVELFFNPSFRGQQNSSLRELKYYSWDAPLSSDPGDKVLNLQSAIDYDKGAIVTRMMAAWLGEEQFTGALGHYLLENRYSLVDAESFRRSLEAYYGKDLKAFFADYVYGVKSLDYELKASFMNRPREDGRYDSCFLVNEKAEGGLFVPITLDLFMEYDARRRVIVIGPGEVRVTTDYPVRYAGLDVDAGTLDSERENNFYPPRTAFIWTAPGWLRQNGATLWKGNFYLATEENKVCFGIGPEFSRSLKWSTGLFPLGEFEPGSLAFIQWGGYGYASWSLPGLSTFSLDARGSEEGHLDFARLTWSKVFSRDTPIGSPGHYYDLPLTLSLTLGLGDFPGPENYYFYNTARLSLDRLLQKGTCFSLENLFRYYPGSEEFRDRVDYTLVQGMPLAMPSLLGIKLYGSAFFGPWARSGAGNQVTAFPSTSGGEERFSQGAKVYLNFPLANNLEIPVLNWFLLQSVNGALFLDGNLPFTSFDSLEREAEDNFQLSGGIEFLAFFRTLGDVTFGLNMGLGININELFASGGDLNAHPPAFFIEGDILPGLYSSYAAY